MADVLIGGGLSSTSDEACSMMEVDDETEAPHQLEAPSLQSMEREVMISKGYTLRDGGKKNLRITEEAFNSPHCPYENFIVSLFAGLIRKLVVAHPKGDCRTRSRPPIQG